MQKSTRAAFGDGRLALLTAFFRGKLLLREAGGQGREWLIGTGAIEGEQRTALLSLFNSSSCSQVVFPPWVDCSKRAAVSGTSCAF